MKYLMFVVTIIALIIAFFLMFYCYLGVSEWTDSESRDSHALDYISVSEWIDPESWGSHALGNNLYVMDFDGGKIVVIGTNIRGNTCYGGIQVIPFQIDSLRNDDYDENDFVVDSKHNEKWAIVKTYFKKTKKFRYYIIDKHFQEDINKEDFINNNIKVYEDSLSFLSECTKDSVYLSF